MRNRNDFTNAPVFVAMPTSTTGDPSASKRVWADDRAGAAHLVGMEFERWRIAGHGIPSAVGELLVDEGATAVEVEFVRELVAAIAALWDGRGRRFSSPVLMNPVPIEGTA